MKKNYLLILILLFIVAAGLVYFLTSSKECQDMNEEECKMADNCLSVLIPCTGSDCTSQAVFTECKDKE